MNLGAGQQQKCLDQCWVEDGGESFVCMRTVSDRRDTYQLSSFWKGDACSTSLIIVCVSVAKSDNSRCVCSQVLITVGMQPELPAGKN